MDTAKAVRLDNMPAIVLTTCVPELAKSSDKMFKYSCNIGIYLTIWKIAQVCLIYKKQTNPNWLISTPLIFSQSSAK